MDPAERAWRNGEGRVQRLVDEQLLVYVAEPRQGARLELRLPGTMTGSLIDPATGDDIQPVQIGTPLTGLVGVELPAGRAAIVVALCRRR